MTRRWILLAGALALCLSAPQAAVAAEQPSSPASPQPDASAEALRDLKADATGAVRVQRDAAGDVAFVSSTNGRAMLDSDAPSPRRSAQDRLAEYGDAFGIDGTTSKAVVTQTLASATGGSVVRADQVVDGVPVFGGQVVMSLDDDQGLVSVSSATTDATQVPAADVGRARAERTAVSVTAKSHRVESRGLTATLVGERLYDPALVQATDPMGVRPVWQLEVTNGSDIRETVLVGTGRGEVALHFNDAPEINRRICDYHDTPTPTTFGGAVPMCGVPARTETGPPSGVSDVNAAYTNLGRASVAYADLRQGLDLTSFIGTDVTGTGTTTLPASVRWCYVDPDPTKDDPNDECPLENAFWDGTQMVFGRGYAAADDVVGHELTHGYVQHTAGLFYLHQSGALNESLADTIGEVIDHRNGSDNDSAWRIGEALPGGGYIRDMKDPQLSGQPDKMTDYAAAGAGDDNGDVHLNAGVGNKTAYLISQGGTFNGETITGIDGSDAGLTKTGVLYLDAIPRLTSGAEYADLGRVLVTTCDELASVGTSGFTTDNCTAVRSAVAATELASPPDDPAAAAPEAAIACPSGSEVNTLLARDDDGIDGFEFDSTSPLWTRADGSYVPSYAVSGQEALFGFDPPAGGDDSSGSVTSAAFTVPASSGGTYLNFHHAYLMESDENGFQDGGEVVVTALVNGAWTPVTGLPWVNGPTKHIEGSTPAGFTGFGGDSRGYGSSQLDLSSLAGKRVQVAFRVEGDAADWFAGWWIDDVRLYACDSAGVAPLGPVAPSVPLGPSVRAAATSATVSWRTPVDRGSKPITAYRVSRSDGKVVTVSAASHSVTLTGLSQLALHTVSIAAINADGLTGPAATLRIYPTVTSITSSTTRAIKGHAFTVTAKVTRRGASTLVAGMPVTLQRHVRGENVWRTVSTAATTTKGTRAWAVKQSQLTYYRVLSQGVTTWLGSTSTTKAVAVR